MAKEFTVHIDSVMACCLTTPNYYLNQNWLIISKVIWHSFESNFIVGKQSIILYDDFENHILEITVTAPNGQ